MADERMELLRRTIAAKGQAQTARELGYSDAAVCQVVKGNYKGDAGRILQRVEEVYGTTTVSCPVLGRIALGLCAQERGKPLAATSPQRMRLWKNCQSCTAWRQA